MDPYLADTNIGLPYWDWDHDSSVPDVWENIPSPIKDHNNPDYNWPSWESWDKEMLEVCHNKAPTMAQSHALRIRKDEYEKISNNLVRDTNWSNQWGKTFNSFTELLAGSVEDALKMTKYEDFTTQINSGHSHIHNICLLYTSDAADE